ncbi:PSD1 and planctomycete cytochrome C domain-containing protein [Maribacter sp. PR1]|uniref:PSD1 and planctomycete cytochrome C domain-containing protein n=1 Tax=Maribacter cobaltidurans TaxID=1178778 RepID=A0ABU7IQY8_9FLAO|nr:MULTISPECIES: PSD1 and planctomycete cytochrome C domain-containing protein [Maribacter]MDC6387911.1 PSD1 and planctomycete cytochrome C domain-containing protein [Maribacter sp. PR1]MEE1975300.1 PSD1 and planctomycete cytochrome C domain-containing protein [Maribacter cobaltidurans]
MKYKITLIVVLVGLFGLLFAYKKGAFEIQKDEYTVLKLPETVDYNFHIKPILSDNCYTCHGPDANKRKAGLRLDLEKTALSELSESPGHFAIVPKNLRESKAYQSIISDDPNQLMPPPDSKLALNSYEKKLVKKWIQQGAKFEKHWAYLTPEKAYLPETELSNWGNNEIDDFILRKLEENKLRPSKKASDETLIRRISLDLIGLPPDPETVQKLLANRSKDNIERIIDAFLASPAYGERMTQSWLDVARYADSHGYQDDSYRTMWPWRDWVIHAFNNNLPYDTFLTWQLAGDLLPNATKEQILATGFNRNHPITQEGGVIQEEYRTNYVLDRTNTLGKGILGLTLECARCHDHKYDAISQENYFEMFAFFNQVDEKGLQMDAVQAKNQKFFADPPYIEISANETKDVLSFINMKKTPKINVMVMNDSAPKTTFVLNRGEYDQPTDSVQPNTPETIYRFSDDLPKNRLGLARWLTDKKNPLTARVYVNRIWGMLFGKGLVETSEDFGVQGSLPSHPKLLDWLAVDFMEHDWDIKYLLKKIMLSATYQQKSELRPDLKNKDPENKLLARAPRFRMSGEMIRDYILTTSGLLNREIGGPSVKPYQPAGLWEETNAGGDRGVLTKYIPDEGDDLYRRSLYTFWKRTLPPPNMTIFDAPTRDFSEVRRQKTNTPLQALVLQNDVQILEAARVMAQRIIRDTPGNPDYVTDVFRRILVRSPKKEELLALNTYYYNALEVYRNAIEDAKKLVIVGNYKQLDVDPAETAALMLTAQVIYNLDETITKE